MCYHYDWTIKILTTYPGYFCTCKKLSVKIFQILDSSLLGLLAQLNIQINSIGLQRTQFLALCSPQTQFRKKLTMNPLQSSDTRCGEHLITSCSTHSCHHYLPPVQQKEPSTPSSAPQLQHIPIIVTDVILSNLSGHQ